MVGLQSVGTIKLIFIEQSHTRRMEARSDRQTADHDILSANAFVEIDHFGRLRPRNRRAPSKVTGAPSRASVDRRWARAGMRH